MIRIEKMVKTFGKVRALDGLDLQVEEGAVYGFLGPNGAGKTTTLRILSGLARPDQGQAWIMGKRVGFGVRDQAGQRSPSSQTLKDHRALLGVLPEEPAFYGWMTPREYLRDFVSPLYGIGHAEAAGRASELLDTVGLAEAADRRIAGFSRGMRQRLGLAGTLVHRPKVLLLDEPVSALDPAGRKEVLDLVEKLRGQATVLLSTHILTDVDRVCDVIGIINQGRMVTQARREDLLERYAMPLFEVESEEPIDAWVEIARRMPFVEQVTVTNHLARLLVRERTLAQKELLASLAAEAVPVRRFEMVTPDLEDVFLRLTQAPEQEGA